MKFTLKDTDLHRKEYHIFDLDSQKVIAVFKKGVFETEDKAVAKKLSDMGYESDEKPEIKRTK